MDEIQFEKAEYRAGSSVTGASCAGCKQPVAGTYHQVGDKVICETCAKQVVAARGRQLSVRDMLSGIALGTLGGLAGAALWAIVMLATKYILGIIAILVGYLVGAGVKKGAGGRGGKLMRAFAVVITFGSIVVAYFPFVFQSVGEDMDGAGAVFAAILGAFVAPFTSVISVILVGFALYRAWKGAAVTWLDVKGPFTLAAAPPADVALTQAHVEASPGSPPGLPPGSADVPPSLL